MSELPLEPIQLKKQKGRLNAEVGQDFRRVQESHGITKGLTATWYRGEQCRFFPRPDQLPSPAPLELLDDKDVLGLVFEGHLPAAPVVSPDEPALMLGSCFTRALSTRLQHRGALKRINDGLPPHETEVGIFVHGAGFLTTITMLRHLEWAVGRRDISGTVWAAVPPGRDDKRMYGHNLSVVPTDEGQRESAGQAVRGARAVVVTFGISEVWEDERGEPFFGAVPAEVFDPDKHSCRMLTVRENTANILGIVDLVRDTCGPDVPIIMTLSPVPMMATFRAQSAMVASSASKAVLRAALDEAMGQREGLWYFPSFEVVRDLYGRPAFQPDLRHIRPAVVEQLVRIFDDHYIQATT